MSLRGLDRAVAILLGAILVATFLLLVPETRSCAMSKSRVALSKVVRTPDGKEREIVVVAMPEADEMHKATAEIEERIREAREDGFTQ